MKDELDFSDIQPASQGEVTREDGPITVDEIRPHLSNQKKEQAQLRMVITSTYPEARVGNQLNDSVFGFEDFGFGEGQSFEEKRVAWMDVPKGTTKEQVEAKLKQYPNARLFRIMSLEPIITEEQIRAAQNGISTYTDPETGEVKPCDEDYYRNRQQVINPETEEPILYNGLPQYRVIGFSVNGKKDVDLRPQQYTAYKQTGEEEEFKMTEAAVSEQAKVDADKF